MRIALVTETFYPANDGTTTTLKAVADRLVDLGHTVRIITPGPGLSTYRTCQVVRVRPLEPTGPQVRAALDAFAPDLVHVTSPGRLGRKTLKHTSRAGIPSVVVEQSPVLDLAADYWRAKVADRTDAVMVTSSWMVDRVAEFGVEATLWQPGVDTAAFTPALRDQWLHDSWSRARSADGPQVVVGYVGGLHKRHHVRRLADLAEVPGIRLVVIGGGSQREWLEARLPGPRSPAPCRPATSRSRSPPSTCSCTPASTRPAATRCARRLRAAYRPWRRAAAAPPTWCATSRPGCSTTRPTRGRSGGPSRRSRPTGTVR